MAGWLALAGGAEFQPGCDEADRLLIDAIGGTAVRVAILPTAAALEGSPSMAAANGIRHFERLGARAEGVMVIDAASANDAGMAAQLNEARIIYIAGGDPGFLLQTLRGSRVWRAIVDAWSGGAVLAGSSAGAMALCSVMCNPHTSVVEQGLGVVQGAAVIPHHRPGSNWLRTLQDALGPSGMVLGIAEQTSLIWVGSQWRVAGPGDVTVYARGQTAVYSSGQDVPLDVTINFTRL